MTLCTLTISFITLYYFNYLGQTSAVALSGKLIQQAAPATAAAAAGL